MMRMTSLLNSHHVMMKIDHQQRRNRKHGQFVHDVMNPIFSVVIGMEFILNELFRYVSLFQDLFHDELISIVIMHWMHWSHEIFEFIHVMNMSSKNNKSFVNNVEHKNERINRYNQIHREKRWNYSNISCHKIVEFIISG